MIPGSCQLSLYNLVPITDFYASHTHCTLNCICKKDHDILYHSTMYHTPLNNTRFSIDAYNVLIASIYLHLYFYVLKISISQNASIISVTEITDEVNRCYQLTVDEKYEEGGE